jgi:ATP-binding cassette subfamily D (ALD) protein 2
MADLRTLAALKNVAQHRRQLLIIAALSCASVFALVYRKARRTKADQTIKEIRVRYHNKSDIDVEKSVLMNREFVRQLRFLLKIVLPGIRSKEFLLLVLHTASLVIRTFLSIYVAKLDGRIVQTLVNRDARGFFYNMCFWLGVAFPATYINSMIRFLESKLSIAFRTRLVQYSYDLYFQNQTYYRVSNLDSRLSNADQCLTEDINRFCAFLAHIHSQISKPLLDIILIAFQLLALAKEKGISRRQTLLPALGTWVVVYLTARFLKWIQPPFGRLTAEQAKLEGDLRFVHSRLIANAEEIAFYNGQKVEKSVLQRAYLSLVKHMNYIFWCRIPYNMFEGFFMKYVWGAAGMLLIAIPAFFFETKSKENVTLETISTRTRDYITSRGLLLSAAEAIERIMLAFKEIAELAGYTSRVYEMIEVFKEVGNDVYRKQTVKGSGDQNNVDMKQRGIVEEGDHIKFENVPIISPNGDVLVESLSFEIKRGMHLLISGPNGCGKSSLFRILGGLWPVIRGRVVKPPPSDIFYIPQKPYLSIGNLRDQVIYPDTEQDMRAKGITDTDLSNILEWVNLNYIVEREGGWDAENDWTDVLSGGEKQRMGMARLFYRKPKFALLDECTSAVSIDVEGKMYQHAIDLGITLLTVTHRPSLWKYHKFLLQFDGEGGWKFSPLNADTRLSLKEEKTKLEAALQGMPQMQKRLKELCKLLGEDSVMLKKSSKINTTPPTESEKDSKQTQKQYMQ